MNISNLGLQWQKLVQWFSFGYCELSHSKSESILYLLDLSVLYAQYAWMEHYLVTTSTGDMGQGQIVGSFIWRFVKQTKVLSVCTQHMSLWHFLYCYHLFIFFLIIHSICFSSCPWLPITQIMICVNSQYMQMVPLWCFQYMLMIRWLMQT